MPEPEKKRRIWEHVSRIEVIFVVLFLISSLSSAFCIYEASQWSGTQNQLYTESVQLTTKAASAHDDANRRILVDVSSFLAWVDAKSQNDTVRAGFIQSRFTPEFKPAFEAWIAQAQGKPPGTIPPDTPFTLPEYRLSAQARSDQLEEQAKALFEQGDMANEMGSEYILITLLFTLVLVLCSVGEKWETPETKRLILVFAVVLFVIAMAVCLWLPKNFG
jgi:hypothetical protein